MALFCRMDYCVGKHTLVQLFFVISGDAVLRVELLEIFHDISKSGHLGLYHMVHQLSHRYYWFGMYHDSQTHIYNCLIC